MMHKAWSSIEEVLCCFSRSSLKFQGHMGHKTPILTRIGRFRTATPVWIYWRLWNDAQSLRQRRRGALLFFKVISQISRSRRTKNCRFWSQLSVSGLWIQFQFTDGCEMMHKAWHNIDGVPYCILRSSMKFHGHTGWNIGDLNPIWVRLLGGMQLSNPSEEVPYCFFKVICQISRSRGTKHCRFWSELSVSGL